MKEIAPGIYAYTSIRDGKRRIKMPDSNPIHTNYHTGQTTGAGWEWIPAIWEFWIIVWQTMFLWRWK